MKTVVICNAYLEDIKPDVIPFDFHLCNENVLIGILDVPQPDYEKYSKEKSVLVSIKAFSCNYRDKSIMLLFNEACIKSSGSRKYFYSPFGSEFVAEVLKVGKDVTTLKVGDRVIPDGSYPFKVNGDFGGIPTNFASQRIQVLDESQLMKIPDTMPDEIAASFTIASQTVYSMLRKLDLPLNANVLVTAATSNTSLSAIQVLKKRGVNVYAISSNKKYENDILKMGVSACIPYSAMEEHTVDNYMGNILFDAVIDPFFDLYYNQIIPYMNFNGKYIYCGLYRQNTAFNEVKVNNNYFKSMADNISKNVTVIANCLGERKDLENAVIDFSNGQYTIVIDSVYTGNEVLPFLQKSFHELPRFGKVVYKYE
jgi:NADPH:quinone reductase-like Zn-dependent oxidoreductase